MGKPIFRKHISRASCETNEFLAPEVAFLTLGIGSGSRRNVQNRARFSPGKIGGETTRTDGICAAYRATICLKPASQPAQFLTAKVPQCVYPSLATDGHSDPATNLPFEGPVPRCPL